MIGSFIGYGFFKESKKILVIVNKTYNNTIKALKVFDELKPKKGHQLQFSGIS